MKKYQIPIKTADAIKDNFNNEQLSTPYELYRATSAIVGKYDIGKRNVILGNGLCPDEVTSGMIKPFADWVGSTKEFYMCRVNGIIKGDGMVSAMSHHVPKQDKKRNGSLVVNATHVGANNDGNFGYLTRFGQYDDSTCCGAAMGYLNNYVTVDASEKKDILENTALMIARMLEKNKYDSTESLSHEIHKLLKEDQILKTIKPDISRDYSIEIMKSMLDPYMDDIVKDKNPPLALTEKLYELVAKDFDERSSPILTKTGDVVYVSGIELDTQTVNNGFANLFVPRNIWLYEKESDDKQDLTKEFNEILEKNKI